MKKISIFLLLSIFIIISCNEDDPVTAFSKDIVLQMNLLNDNEIISIGDTVKLINDRDLIVLKSNMYISNLRVSNSNEEVELDSILFYEIGEMDRIMLNSDFAGSIDEVKFDIGVDPAWNLSDPTLVASSHPLGINNSGNHWNWNVGYIFYKFEGLVDNDLDGAFETFFVYHIGKNEFYQSVILKKNIPQISGATRVLDIGIDVKELFNSIDFEKENSSHSTGDEIYITEKISNNLSNAIQ